MGTAVCIDCNQPMERGAGCTLAEILIDGTMVERIRFRDGAVCHDCGETNGQLHHLGCDMERCPRCGSQLISCGCWTDGWEEDDEKEFDE